jgi:hypothetical protein
LVVVERGTSVPLFISPKNSSFFRIAAKPPAKPRRREGKIKKVSHGATAITEEKTRTLETEIGTPFKRNFARQEG